MFGSDLIIMVVDSIKKKKKIYGTGLMDKHVTRSRRNIFEKIT